ncbi:MAG TPA: NAD(P)H-dependent oxidoreductase [Candidatus Sulfopaludibacter sp.]|jgi:NAD(P)H-dependent FMN reductase|nr:NAD(P)H-dependent oxidoreductase [Candidatus Sulfopaludibacter sp.]
MNTLNILGIAGSMRKDSNGTKILKIALDLASKYKAQTSLLELRKTNMPLYNPDLSIQSDIDMQKVTDQVNQADAFILVSPDYHGSMSGSMKNFLDYYWEEFAGKTFGYICTSHEKGLTVMDQMRTAVRQCYGWSLPYGISVNGSEDINEGQVTNNLLNKRLKMLAHDLVAYSKLIREQFLQDLSSDLEDTFAARYR